jgi:hypothetical protein
MLISKFEEIKMIEEKTFGELVARQAATSILNL